jgi:hypothetical protein
MRQKEVPKKEPEREQCRGQAKVATPQGFEP